MVFVVLCGGLGTRMAQGTLPKPLTPILGRPSLKYALEHVAPLVPELVFIYASHLAAYGFEETVAGLFAPTKCTFTCVPFATRGAVETALAGLLQLALDPAAPVVFLDNDSVYPAALAALAAPRAPFLGFDTDAGGVSTAYSFLQRTAGGAVTAFAEKKRISDDFCTGVYGFASAAQFLRWGQHALRHGPFPNNEIYMSSVFVNMIAAGEAVASARVPIVPLGTTAMAAAFMATRAEKLRICFDLDNTLVTPPRVPGDYATVQPVAATVALARWASAAGHTVIVHTARRAPALESSTGRVTADIGKVTIETLEKFGIPFDELLFGKPAADVHIDARAVNPFFNSPRVMGLPHGDAPDATQPLPNALPSTTGKTLRVVGGRVIKRGPSHALRGEAFFYEAASALPIARFFPAFFGCAPVADGGAASFAGDADAALELTVDLLKGVPLATLMRARLLAGYHVDAVLGALAELHSCAEVPLTLPLDALRGNLVRELRERFAVPAAYGTLAGARGVLAVLEERLARYEADGAFAVARIVHGAPRLANAIITPSNGLRFIAMRGRVGGALTLNGDAGCDFAAVCMSLVGFDEVVFGFPRAPHAYRAGLLRRFAEGLRAAGVQPARVLDVCAALIAGSLPLYEGALHDALWALACKILDPAGDAEWAELVEIMQ